MLVIASHYFYCGVVLEGKNVVRTAPIVGYMLGWSLEQVEAYCLKKRWSCTLLQPLL